MGKAGNKARREARREKEATQHATLDDNIQQILREDEWREKVLSSAPTKEQYDMMEVNLLGPPGPPKDDNIVWLGKPPSRKRRVVDCLGRVVEVEDVIPESLRSAMPAKTTSISTIVEPKHDTVLSLPTPKRRVTLMRDSELVYPELWMEVFVEPDPTVRDDEARFAQMFARSRCSRAKSVLEADLVVFAGGSDVDPVLYGETAHETTHVDPHRDQRDMDLYLMCVENGIPMLGVCRGAQFLHVMNGGKLYQDIDKHYGDHRIFDIRQKDFIQKVSSVHHQACRSNVNNGQQIIATSGDARKRWLNATDKADGAKADIEAYFYRSTCCLGVQGHPEYQGYQAYTKWVLELINQYVLCSPDIEWRDGNRRIKLELLEERNLVKAAAKQETN